MIFSKAKNNNIIYLKKQMSVTSLSKILSLNNDSWSSPIIPFLSQRFCISLFHPVRLTANHLHHFLVANLFALLILESQWGSCLEHILRFVFVLCWWVLIACLFFGERWVNVVRNPFCCSWRMDCVENRWSVKGWFLSLLTF